MSFIPEEIERHYLQTKESERLTGSRGELELLRTQAILARHLPPRPATIFDVGGAAGVYAFPLAKHGYPVHLIDPVDVHLQQARSYAAESGITLASVARGDARQLDIPSNSADAVLLLGPLYHLVEYADRLQALSEARRILKAQGVLFAAAVCRFASLIDGLSSGFFRDAEFRKIGAADLASGQHRNPTNHPAYFDRKGLDLGKAGVADFGRQVLRTVKISGREVRRVVRRIAMLTGGEIRRNDLAKLRVSKEATRETIDQ